MVSSWYLNAKLSDFGHRAGRNTEVSQQEKAKTKKRNRKTKTDNRQQINPNNTSLFPSQMKQIIGKFDFFSDTTVWK